MAAINIPLDELSTTNKVFSLRFMSGEVHYPFTRPYYKLRL